MYSLGLRYLMLFVLAAAVTQSQTTGALVAFPAPAAGGEIRVSHIRGDSNVIAPSLSQRTIAGQEGRSVLESLRARYKYNPLFCVDVLDREISGMCGVWTISGTETGLGIPPPPRSVTWHYNATSKRGTLVWLNSCSYTFAYALDLNAPMWSGLSEILQSGPLQSKEFFEPFADGIIARDIWIIGEQEDHIPSDAAGMHVCQNAQEELYSIPFFGGIAPNWSAWQLSSSTVLKEATKASVTLDAERVVAAEQKPYYQVIQGTDEQACGGIWRHFLALEAGHVYRVYVRINTLAMDGVTQERQVVRVPAWRYSVHATPNKTPSVDGLTVLQFAGKQALPDGTLGEDSAVIAEFGPSRTTEGKWLEVATGHERGAMDITVPTGFDSITVWLRLTGYAPTGVAMDWIKLEDLGDARHSE